MEENQKSLKHIDEQENDVTKLQNQFNTMPEEEQKKFLQLVVSKSFSGPLPPSEDFARYDQVTPGAGDRILKLSEKQLEHRIKLEELMINSEIKASTRGQWISFFVCFVIVVAGIYFVCTGKDIQGFIAMMAPLAILIGALRYDKKSRKE